MDIWAEEKLGLTVKPWRTVPGGYETEANGKKALLVKDAKKKWSLTIDGKVYPIQSRRPTFDHAEFLILKHFGKRATADKVAAKTEPSLPQLSDKYEATNLSLWKDVLDVASGERRELTLNDRTIHSPNEGRGYRNMPHNPKGIAWAVKQYKGFGGNFRGQKEAAIPGPWEARMRRMAAGGVECTAAEGETAEAHSLVSQGLLRLASSVGSRHYWDLTEEGLKVALTSLTDELKRRVEGILRSFDPGEAKRLGEWIEANFRINSPKTPSGGKKVKEQLQRMVWTLKNRHSQGSDPSDIAQEVQRDWDDIKGQLPLLVKFTDEGGTVVPKDLVSGGVTYINEAGASEAQLKKYVARLDAVFKSIKGWRAKALSGSLTVVLKPPSAFNGTVSGKYKRSEDALWVRTTPSILKRAQGYGSFEYIIVHELGHRYERYHSLPTDFDKVPWHTTRYSRSEGEAFAELFALGHFKLTGSWDNSKVDRFEGVMTGKEKLASGVAPETWAD